MAAPETLEKFIRKWGPAIQNSMDTIHQSIVKAGYGASGPDEYVELDEDPPFMRWNIFTSLPNRPEEETERDIMVDFMILADEEEEGRFTPILEAMNDDGNIQDDVKLSEVPLAPEDDAAWATVFEKLKSLAPVVTEFIQHWNPKPAKNIWTLKVTLPGNIAVHPSIHTRADVARAEIIERLYGMVDMAAKLLWDLEAQKQYAGWSSDSTTLLMDTRMYLDQGKAVKAFRQYQNFLKTLDPNMRDLINRIAGTLDIDVSEGLSVQEVES